MYSVTQPSLTMKRIINLISLLLLCSCTPLEVRNLLKDVDSYIMERPDSALTVLESVDRTLLKSERSRAHHALLHAMALDKNYIDVTEDSIAQVAVDYYSRKGPEKSKARAYYYLGLAYYYQKDYDKAILEFTKAEKVAEECDSLYWGMTKSAQAGAYSATYNDIETYNCLLKAYEIYESLSDTEKVHSIQLKLANLYISQFDFFKAEETLLKLIDEDINDLQKVQSFALYAYLKMVQPEREPEKSIEFYERCFSYSGVMNNQDYWAYAFALSLVGRNEESKEITDELVLTDTTSSAPYWLYLINKYKGNTAEALSYLEESGFMDNEVVTAALNQSLSLAQRDYYESQTELAEYQLRNRTLMILSLIIGIAFIAMLTIVSIRKYIRTQKEEKERYIQYIDEISSQMLLLQQKADSLPVIKRKYLELYKSKYENLRVLCDQYLQFEGRNDVEGKIYRQVISMIDEIRNDSNDVAELENILNNDLDGIMSNLRNEIKMKEIDYRVFSYLVIGFDATTISRLLDTTVNIIYIRKSRIKHYIESSDAMHKTQFMEMIV